MGPAVPRYVHEPDELIPVSGANPPQAVPLDLAHPVVIKRWVAKSLGMQRVDFNVLEVSPPLITHIHRAIVSPGATPRG
jgi:hypothetical protein